MAHPLTRRSLRRLAPAALLTAALAVPTVASASTPPLKYGLTFIDGAAKRGYQYDSVRVSSVRDFGRTHPVTARVLRGSAVIGAGTSQGQFRAALVPTGLGAGDIGQVLTGPGDDFYDQYTYDGLPSFDSICAGSTTVTGARTTNSTVISAAVYDDPSGVAGFSGFDGTYAINTQIRPASRLQGLGGDRYQADFAAPLVTGQYVYVVTSVDTGKLLVRQIHETVVGGACAPADLTPPKATLSNPKGLRKLTLKALGKGVTFRLRSSEDATVTAVLGVRTGRKGKKKETILSTTTLQAKGGRSTKVRFKATKKTRTKLRKASRTKGAKLFFRFTLVDAAGNTTTGNPLLYPVPRR